MIVGLTYLLIGVMLTWVGWRHWRFRKEETVSALETSILHVTGESPRVRTHLDRLLTYIQAFFGFVLGPFFFLIGLVVTLGELGIV